MGPKNDFTELISDSLDVAFKSFPFLKEYRETIENIKNLITVAKHGFECFQPIKEIMIDPYHGFVLLVHYAAKMFKTVTEYLQLASKLPKEVQTNVERLKRLKSETEQLLEKILKSFGEMNQAITDQDGVKFSSTDQSKLNLKLINLEEDCKTCERKLNQIKNDLDDMQRKVREYFCLYAIGYIVSPFLVGGVFGWIGNSVGCFAAGVAGGALAINYKFRVLQIISDYCVALEECDSIKESLKSLAANLDEAKEVKMQSMKKKIKELSK